MKCETCRFYEEEDKDDVDAIGMCRARSPQATAYYRTGFWPIVFSDDWCGEYVAKEEELKAERFGVEIE